MKKSCKFVSYNTIAEHGVTDHIPNMSDYLYTMSILCAGLEVEFEEDNSDSKFIKVKGNNCYLPKEWLE